MTDQTEDAGSGDTGSSTKSPLAALIDGQTLALVPKSISGYLLFEAGVSSRASLAFMMIYLRGVIYKDGARGAVEFVRGHMAEYFEITEGECDGLLEELADARMLLATEEAGKTVYELPPQAFQVT